MANQPPYAQGPYPLAQQPAKKGLSGCAIAAIVVAVLAVPIIGIMAALGIYGFRRYLAAAKTAEAKNSVGAISRAAIAAYEREGLVGGRATHRLCGSATPVPARVPPARKYQPSAAPGADFQTGSADEGWACLRFASTMPMYYQYQYHAGSGWVVPANAPGPDGFEAAAVGDLNGDGTHSHFAMTGKVVSGSVVVSRTLYIDNEFE